MTVVHSQGKRADWEKISDSMRGIIQVGEDVGVNVDVAGVALLYLLIGFCIVA